MEDTLYDTSWTLFSIHNNKNHTLSPSTSFLNLLLHSANETLLHTHASKLLEFLLSTGTSSNGRRPRYEEDEEREKIGALRDCEWTLLGLVVADRRNTHRPSTRGGGVLIKLTYDKAIYKFILRGGGGGRRSNASRNDDDGHALPLPLLLAKASAPLTKRIISFLSDSFHISINPLKLRPSLLQSILQSHLSSLYSAAAAFSPSVNGSAPANIQSLLRSTFGSLKLTIGLSSATQITPSLRSIELDIPPETTYQLLVQSQSTSTSNTSFLAVLAQHIHARTGLKLPTVQPQPQPQPHDHRSATSSTERTKSNGVDADDAVLRLIRISCAAYALSVEGRLKFAGKAIDIITANDDDGNVAMADDEFGQQVRKANEEMLLRIVDEAVLRRADLEKRGEEGEEGEEEEEEEEDVG